MLKPGKNENEIAITKVSQAFIDAYFTNSPAPLNVYLSLGLRAPLITAPSSTGFPAEMSVEYVRVWQK